VQPVVTVLKIKNQTIGDLLLDTHGWSPERRARQAELIHRWKPWTKSTGPSTAGGKKIVGQNAHRFTYRKALIFACWLGKQSNHFQAGRQFANRETVARMFEAAFCECMGEVD
jgi:hypothetical protein